MPVRPIPNSSLYPHPPIFMAPNSTTETLLSRSDPRHVVMLAQVAQIPIQLLDPLFVRLGAFALQPFVELYRDHEHFAIGLRILDVKEGEKHSPFSVSAPRASAPPPSCLLALMVA